MKNYTWLLPLLLIGAAVAAYVYWPRLRKAAKPASATGTSGGGPVYDSAGTVVQQPWMQGGGVLQG